MSEPTSLETTISELSDQLPPPEAASAPGMRDLFLEILTISLGNLYSKMPQPGTLYDRTMLKVITEGIDDNDVAKLTNRGEDWMRLEGIVRVVEGQKAYALNRPSMAVLSTQTAMGPLGNVMERITRAYAEGRATPELRRSARALGTYFLTRIARN